MSVKPKGLLGNIKIANVFHHEFQSIIEIQVMIFLIDHMINKILQSWNLMKLASCVKLYFFV